MSFLLVCDNPISVIVYSTSEQASLLDTRCAILYLLLLAFIETDVIYYTTSTWSICRMKNTFYSYFQFQIALRRTVSGVYIKGIGFFDSRYELARLSREFLNMFVHHKYFDDDMCENENGIEK